MNISNCGIDCDTLDTHKSENPDGNGIEIENLKKLTIVKKNNKEEI